MKFLETHRVDVVISDIKMHGHTGLEIAKYVKNKNPQTFVILITGHLLFEYAKEAIDNKVDYFLTKPFSSDEFLKIMCEIEEKISNNIELTRLDAKTYLNRWEYLTNILSRIFQGKLPAERLYNELCCVSTRQFKSLSAALVDIKPSVLSDKSIKPEQIISFDSFNISSFFLGVRHNRYFSSVFYTNSEYLDSYVNDICQLFRENNIDIKIKITDIKNIDYFYNIQIALDMAFEYFSNIRHNLSDDLLIDSITRLSDIHIKVFYNLLTELFMELGTDISNTSLTRQNAKTILNQTIPSMMPAKNIYLNTVEAAMKYIEKNYSDYSLSLSAVADALHVSADYLGKLFKTQLNTNYSDYISNYRFKKAKELLKTTDLSIAQISNLVGYRDIHYFRKLFKNRTGISPVAYRKQDLIDKIYEKNQ